MKGPNYTKMYLIVHTNDSRNILTLNSYNMTIFPVLGENREISFSANVIKVEYFNINISKNLWNNFLKRLMIK